MADTRIKAGQFFGVIGHGTDGYFLMTNADGSMSWSQASTGPSVTSVDYPGDDTAADPAGGQTVVLTGTGFATSNMSVTIGGTTAPSVAHDSNTQLTITTPAKAAGDYDIVVTNGTTGTSGTFVNGISYNGIPTWTTAAGSLGTFESETTISTITLAATEPDGGTITFNITNGALPTGLSLTGANIDGTTTAESSTTLYSFTIEAIDDENQATPRNFSITVNAAAIVSSENFTINTYTGNGSTQSIEGKIGTAAFFNGSSSVIETPNIIGTNIEFSASLWVNGTDMNKNSSDPNLIETILYNRNPYVVINQYNGNWEYTIKNSSSQNTTISYATSNFNDNQWYHFVITCNGLGGQMNMYVDGVNVGSNTAPTSTINVASTGFIGSGGSSQWFDGKIDQVRIFNKALSSSEVTTLYGESNTSTSKSTTDIFDDGSGVALYEFEKGAKDTGGAGTNGKFGDAAFFNGSSSYIDIPTIPNITGLGSDFSFSAWINFDGTSGDRYIMSFRENSYIELGFNSGYSPRKLEFKVNDGSNKTVLVDESEITYNSWHHICLTAESSGNLTAYLDGTVKGTTSIASIGNAGQQNSIGAYSAGSVAGYFTGKIDDVRIYSDVLTSQEVGYIYNNTTASIPTDYVAYYKLDGDATDETTNYDGTVNNVSFGYDGTPTNVSFVGTSFQPDLVWIKNRSEGYNHQLTDSVRGEGTSSNSKSLVSNNDQYEGWSSPIYGYLSSFDANGFTLTEGTANSDAINRNGNNYVAWCWKAGGVPTPNNNTQGTITSTVSANVDAGFSIVKWTGSALTANTVGHGLSSAPEMIIYKATSAVRDWNVYSAGVGPTANMHLNRPFAANNDEPWAVNSTTFAINDQSAIENRIAYCFHSVDGYQRMGTYSGINGTDVKVYTDSNGDGTGTGAFQPRFVMVKAYNDTTNWGIFDYVRDGSNPTYKPLFPSLFSVEPTPAVYGMQFDNDGFTVKGYAGGNDISNKSGATYIYLAIA